MDYKALLDVLMDKDDWMPVRLSNFNSAQASIRRSLKRYNQSVDALGVGTKYSLVSRTKGEGEWELKLIPLNEEAKIVGASVKYVILDDIEPKEVSDDEFDWSIN